MEQTHKYRIPLTGSASLNGVGSPYTDRNAPAGSLLGDPNLYERSVLKQYAQQTQWSPNAPPPPVIKSQLQGLIEELGHLTGRVMSHAIRTGNIADRLLGLEPEGTDGAGKLTPPAPENLLGRLAHELSSLREHLGHLDHNVERLERL